MLDSRKKSFKIVVREVCWRKRFAIVEKGFLSARGEGLLDSREKG